jgi:acetyl esterase/lipase
LRGMASLLRASSVCFIVLLGGLARPGLAADAADTAGTLAGWPPQVSLVRYLSAADHTLQPTLFYKPEGGKPVPLLVALHTWSYGCQYPEPDYAKWCIAKGWAFVHPEFRGPNNRPEACGSDLAVQDILSAVDYARQHAAIDPDRIYLVGVSGGGHAAMLLAGRAPALWAGVSAWCGIFDLKDWYEQCQARKLGYADAIAQACGGPPGTSPAVDEQYRRRSGSAWLENAKNVPLDLNTGIHDGHQGSVPDSHSLRAFNLLAAPADRLADADIAFITDNAAIPASLPSPAKDPLYAGNAVLLRKTSGNARVTVFDAGHTIIYEAALNWLERQRKGQPAQWNLTSATPGTLQGRAVEAGK